MPQSLRPDFHAIAAFIAYKVADLTVGLRVSEEAEREGLDYGLAASAYARAVHLSAADTAMTAARATRADATNLPDSSEAAADAVVLKAQRLHQPWVIEVAAIQQHRLAQGLAQRLRLVDNHPLDGNPVAQLLQQGR